MTFKIYNYLDKDKLCQIPNDIKIKAIIILKISGDEIVHVYPSVGQPYIFDSDTTRVMHTFESITYLHTPKKIEKFLKPRRVD